MTTDRTEFQRIHLERLAKSFGVDTAPAQHLTGQELDSWLNSSEDVLFEQCPVDLREMKAERERGYRPKPAPAP